MSLINNLIEQIKEKERLNYNYYINSTRNTEIINFLKECEKNKQNVYPTWSSIKILSSRNENKKQKKGNIGYNSVIVIDDDNDGNYINYNITNDDSENSISSRTRSKTGTSNINKNRVTLDDFFFPTNYTNNFNNINLTNNINNTSNANNISNTNEKSKTSTRSNRSRKSTRNYFSRGFFRRRGRKKRT
ncbi:hypothetical protein BCR32DRAFT_329681 [Anaeromyces robustus]|uniref:Uncharacterized protein n=1 Tax=Anaeromyces robustus TaxID=1754192 RepID=A0A1Y1WQZ7_9FUNG|nr:hypothetical protein BCR32DRAFT_329681 [Anaeromyces robustus]|eukprot:ORX75718.1 hypothetical protein BCR32DRAFT_329681 [Anaeromyces robustus]